MKRKILSFILSAALVFSLVCPGTVASAQASSLQWSPVGPDPYMNRVRCLTEYNGKLYKVTYADGVLVWNGTDWTQVGVGSWPSDDSVSCLVGASGTLFAGTYRHGVWKLDGGSWTQVGEDSWPIAFGYPDRAENLVYTGGILYVQAAADGVLKLSGDGVWTQAGTSWPASTRVNSMTADADGIIYAGTDDGVLKLDIGGAWTQAGASWPASTRVNSMAAAGGKIYAGTHDGVWAMGSDGAWKKMGDSAQFEDDVSQLTDVSGTLYAGNQYGLWFWDSPGWTRIALPFSLDANNIDYYLASAEGTLYCGGGDYVYLLNGGAWQEVGSYNGLPYCSLDAVNLPVADFNGTLYAGTYGGVWAYDGGAWAQVGASSWPKFNGFAARASSLLVDGQTVYAGTELSGVWQLAGGAWTQVGNSWPSGQGVWCLTFFDNTLYAGTFKWDSSYPSGAGVYALNGGIWTSVGDNTDGDWINSLASVGGKLYAATQADRVHVLENGDWSPLDPYPYPSGALCLENVGGTLYAGTGGSYSTDNCILWAWDGTSWTEKASADGESICCLHEIDGTLYAGTNRGVFTVDTGSGNLTQVGDCDNTIFSFAKIGGILYASNDYSVMAYGQTYTIAAAAGGGGSISPSGSVYVVENDTKVFTITPDSGHQIASVTVDGVDQGAVPTYTFSNVTADHTINAVFSPVPPPTTQYKITATAGSGGTISPSGDESGNVYVISGDTQIFYITPGSGYQIGSVTVDGVPQGAITTYTFTNVTADHTINAVFASTSGGGDGGGGSVPSQPSAPTVGSDGNITVAPPALNQSTGIAATQISSSDLNTAFKKASQDSNGVKTVKITVPPVQKATGYETSLPIDALASSAGTQLAINTAIATVTLPGNMLQTSAGASGAASLSVSQADVSTLSPDVRAAIGDRPVIQLILSVNGQQTEWNNPSAPVTVSIPYTPTAEELAHPESIVVWYIDGSGSLVSVPSGRYDPVTGTVAFQTTHFSNYAVGYNKVSFNDVASAAWYSKAVSFLAARGITDGTGGGSFSPSATLKRGDFLVLLMKAYGIAPDTNPVDNFADAGSTYYTGYLAAAKRLGITNGVGNNLYAPGTDITRQEMFTLLYNALKAIGKLPQGNSGKTLSDFSDSSEVASWAQGAMKLLVETGTVGGSGGTLSPAGTTTRAEMAQVLFNLLGK